MELTRRSFLRNAVAAVLAAAAGAMVWGPRAAARWRAHRAGHPPGRRRALAEADVARPGPWAG